MRSIPSYNLYIHNVNHSHLHACLLYFLTLQNLLFIWNKYECMQSYLLHILTLWSSIVHYALLFVYSIFVFLLFLYSLFILYCTCLSFLILLYIITLCILPAAIFFKRSSSFKNQYYNIFYHFVHHQYEYHEYIWTYVVMYDGA